MRELLTDFLLPETDRGAVIQWIVMAVIWAAVLFAVRGCRREYRLFAIGLAFVNVAWFAARTVH